MKKIFTILILLLFPNISVADSVVELVCSEIPIDGTDYGKQSIISWYDIDNTVNFDDFLWDSEWNTYQILGSPGSYYVKINDRVSDTYNYIYNDTTYIDIQNGKMLFKVYDFNGMQHLVYFDGTDFYETESFSNIDDFRLSFNGLKYIYLVIHDDFNRELYLNNELLDSWMIPDDFAFSRDSESFSYLKLSWELVTNNNGTQYYPDTELYKDWKLLQTFKNSSHHRGSMRYIWNGRDIGVGFFIEWNIELDDTWPVWDNYIYTRNGEIYEIPSKNLELKDVVYNNDATKFYTSIETDDWQSYFTDGTRKSSNFEWNSIIDIQINQNTWKPLFFAMKRNQEYPGIRNRYLVYDWIEYMDQSELTRKYEEKVLNNQEYTNFGDSRPHYVGTFFWKEDDFYSIEYVSAEDNTWKYSPIYYIRKNFWEHQTLDTLNPHNNIVKVFDNSFSYFTTQGDTKSGTYHVCTISDTPQSKNINNPVADKWDTLEEAQKFELHIQWKLEIIDRELMVEKRVRLYKNLISALENIQQNNNNNNYKVNILLKLSKKHYKKSFKEYILQSN